MSESACQTCGACCGYFRVSFYWREAEQEDKDFPVPKELTEDQSSHLRCMKGTNQKHYNRCVALEGKIGEQVQCSIYLHRPSPCRDFKESYENGIRNPKCDEARAAYGLPPLKKPLNFNASKETEVSYNSPIADRAEPNLRDDQGAPL